MKQAIYIQIITHFKELASKNQLTPDEILAAAIEKFQNENHLTLKQIHQQWYSHYVKITAPMVYSHLEKIWPKTADDLAKQQRKRNGKNFQRNGIKLINGGSVPSSPMPSNLSNSSDLITTPDYELLTVETINEIINCHRSMPAAWLIKHIILRSKFTQHLKLLPLVSNSLKNQKNTDEVKNQTQSSSTKSKEPASKPFSQLSLDAIYKYISKQTLDTAVQLKSLIENDEDNSILKTSYLVIKKLILVQNNDKLFGPVGNSLLHQEGVECEKLIKKFLNQHKVQYIPENQQRILGYDKTPDFLLSVPIVVHFADTDGSLENSISSLSLDNNNNTKTNSKDMVICWIESKCMFGDRDTVAKHYQDQFEPYYQRYGPGIIIYFRGFVDEVDLSFSNTDSMKMIDCLPKSVTQHSCYFETSQMRIYGQVANGTTYY